MNHEQQTNRSTFDRVADGRGNLLRFLPKETDMPHVLVLQPEHPRKDNPYTFSPYRTMAKVAVGVTIPPTGA